MGMQAVEQSETIHRVEDACICSSLHIQGRFTYMESHRCPLHNDTLEHDCTTKNIVPGLIVPSDERLDTPQPVEDQCICSSLHVHGNYYHHYHHCPVHNDTMEHDYTHDNIVTGQSKFVQFREMPEIISTPEPVKDASLHVHGNSVNVCYYHRCPIHNNTAS